MTGSPLRVHFVWIGARFPYFARLAVESALVAMPDCRVDLNLVGAVPRGDHLAATVAHDRVHVERWTPGELFASCPLGAGPYHDLLNRVPTGSPATISNLARLAILFQRGGIYLDTDVLVLRGLHDPERHGAFVGRERVWDLNRRRVSSGLGVAGTVRAIPWATRWTACELDLVLTHGRLHLADRLPNDRHTRLQVNNAVIGAPRQSEFIALALEQALDVDPTVRFALGPSMLDDVSIAVPRLVTAVPPSRFYAVPPGHSHRWFADRTLELPPDAQVMHYVASNHRRLLANLDAHDPRFERETAPFWKHGARVQAAVAAPSGRSLASVG